jgi:uncharacterized protein YehS (DUF1456 family)
MDNNYILRSLRYALKISDSKMVEIFGLGEHKISKEELLTLLKQEEDKNFLVCSDKVMSSFLDGLIIHKRGKQENKAGAPQKSSVLSNNTILKKIRIALNFKEEDMLATFKLAELNVSKSELTAIFRRPDHKNYKECGDQFIKNFLKGLALKQ